MSVHYGPYNEIGLLPDGCKRMQCETCGNEIDVHFKVYGCRDKSAV